MTNKIYNETKQNCIYGHFNNKVPAGYTLTNGDKLNGPWYYVYQNRKILLYVDQNGPVKIQCNPPSGILLCKRELGENQSKWQVWVQSKDLNSGVPVSNFNTPVIRHDLEKPVFTVDWAPEKAVYKAQYNNVDIITEIFMPVDKPTVCMKTTIVNKTEKDMDFTVTPAFFPYVNMPQMVAWDLPEWYLSTTARKGDNAFSISGQMTDPSMDLKKYRSVTFNVDFDENAEFELNMSNFARSGNFLTPKSVIENLPLGSVVGKVTTPVEFQETQAVWAVRYNATVKANDKKAFTQVVTLQESNLYSEQEDKFERNYFDQQFLNQTMQKSKGFYANLFSKRSIKTNNEIYDNFINYFSPLQMYWVCSLDRGWPSSMRGTRDASQDFVGMLPLDPVWTKKTILQLLSHQRTDGWFPRQISTISRQAPHDMRNFCDGGAFFLELLYEYLAFTRDADLFNETVFWLDSDEQSTVLEHVERCVNYYINPQNIGEHGLCKAWHGDWWDVLDHVGSDGRGETVTVTAQMVVNLKYMAEIFSWMIENGKLDNSYLEKINQYKAIRENFIASMRKYALNSKGYFNGYFNDNGKWLFSDNDPDGEERMFLVSNAWAIISGVADKTLRAKVLENIERLAFDRMGYNTNSSAFKIHVDKAGRVGNGALPGVAPYNHAQSFLVRACCVAGEPEKAYKTTRYILPIEEAYAPVEKTFAPPYAIANSYSNSDFSLHRVELQFLSGTVSYVLRTVYSYFFGITFGLKGLTLKPCMPADFGDCQANFTYLGKQFTINMKKTENQEKAVKVNGEVWNKTTYCVEEERNFTFIGDGDMKDENIIEIEY